MSLSELVHDLFRGAHETVKLGVYAITRPLVLSAVLATAALACAAPEEVPTEREVECYSDLDCRLDEACFIKPNETYGDCLFVGFPESEPEQEEPTFPTSRDFQVVEDVTVHYLTTDANGQAKFKTEFDEVVEIVDGQGRPVAHQEFVFFDAQESFERDFLYSINWRGIFAKIDGVPTLGLYDVSQHRKPGSPLRLTANALKKVHYNDQSAQHSSKAAGEFVEWADNWRNYGCRDKVWMQDMVDANFILVEALGYRYTGFVKSEIDDFLDNLDPDIQARIWDSSGYTPGTMSITVMDFVYIEKCAQPEERCDFRELRCFFGDVYEWDTCGEGSMYEECGPSETCVDAQCVEESVTPPPQNDHPAPDCYLPTCLDENLYCVEPCQETEKGCMMPCEADYDCPTVGGFDLHCVELEPVQYFQGQKACMLTPCSEDPGVCEPSETCVDPDSDPRVPNRNSPVFSMLGAYDSCFPTSCLD